MRILTEIIGGIVLLVVFAYGVMTVIEYSTLKREKNNGDSNKVPRSPDTAPPKPD